MATLEQIAEGIRRADAAGDIESVKALGQAYVQMQQAQANPDAPPAGAVPGSPDYAKWAAEQARAGKPLPQVSEPPPEWKDPNLTGPMGKFDAAYTSAVSGVPVLGPTLLEGVENLRATVQGLPVEQVQAEGAAAREANPITSLAGNVTGAVASLGPLGMTSLGARALGMTGSLPARIGFGAGSGAAIAGADTLARGGTPVEAGQNALLGAGLGAALPAIGAGVRKVGQGMAQRRATNAAIKGAPAAADLKSASSAMFQQLDQSGVQVSGYRLGQWATDLVQKFVKMRANPRLDPKATAALEEVALAVNQAQQAGQGLTLSELHTLRQIAQRAATSTEGRDAMFANMIVDDLDNMIQGLKPADMLGGANPNQAAKLMYDAIGTWGRSKRVGLIEEAIYKAQNQASGFENGLRIQFRQLLQNPRTRRLFSEAERQAIQDVVRGGPVSNLAKLLGKFGFGTGNASNMLGGTIGALAGSATPLGPIGGILLAGAGTGARKASEKLTERAANRAAQVVATPNVPVLPTRPMPDALIAPASLPVAVTQQRPLEITVPYREMAR